MSDEILRGALSVVVSGRSLDVATARSVMDLVMEGAASPAQMGALLAALRTKGETVDELTGFVMSMRDHATLVAIEPGAVDTCGTGGDGSDTFNISTAAAIVAAAAGCRVAKHGGRASSSRCGSADVLEALGVTVSLDAAGVRRCLRETSLGFLFAPAFHPAMRHAAPVRRELGVRTVFNILGPLANPARVRHQALGVAGTAPVEGMAQVLQRLGHEHALVFSGPGGMDELGLDGPAHGFEVTGEGVRPWSVDPQALGLASAPPEALRGGDAATNARLVRAVLLGEPGPRRDVVLLNAAAAMVAADHAADMREGIDRAAAAIRSGAAAETLQRLVAVSSAAADVPP
ncbi:MAG: anthranilate phosphoribosyltransferase [Candidatus Dormibacteria bacterium]